MPIEFDDTGLRIIGYNVKAIQFLDPGRVLRQEIFLQEDNTLNTGDTGLEGQGGAATGGMVSHDLSGGYHTGTLASAQAPQFLLTDGTRALTGNLAVDSGVTIDGVDISSHGTRHLPGAADALTTAVAGSITPDASAAEGGAASFARSDHVHGIVCAAPGADSVHVGASAEGNAASFARSNHTHNLDEAIAPTWTGGHTFQEDIQLEADLDFVGAQSITTTAGNLTIAPAGDLVLDPAGNDVLPGSNYDINLGMLSKKYLTLHCAELWVETLVAQDTIATIGGRILVGPTTTLTSDLAPGGTTIYVKHNQMASGDRAYMEADGKVEFMSIDSAPGGSGPYSYTVTRNLDGTGANTWYAGDAVFNTGTTGDGFIDLYSIQGVVASGAGPTIVGNVRDSATYNAWTEYWAIGNLNGLYGYGTDTYGAAFGKYSAADYITIDASNGIRFLDSADAVQGQLTSAVWTLGNVAGGEYVSISSAGIEMRSSSFLVVDISNTGDFTLGRVETNMGNMFYDQSEGRLNFRGGVEGEVVEAYIDTDGSITAGGGVVTLDTGGIDIAATTDYADIRAYTFSISGTTASSLSAKYGADYNYIKLEAEEIADRSSHINIFSYGPNGKDSSVWLIAQADHSASMLLQSDESAGYSAIYWTTDKARLRLGDTAGAYTFSIEDSSTAEVFSVDSDGDVYIAGDVGIGTSGPLDLLHVRETTAATDARIIIDGREDPELKFAINDGTTTTVKFTLGVDNSLAGDPFIIGTTNVDNPLVAITSDGNVGIAQGASDANILTLASTDVAHGMTALAASSVYGMFLKTEATSGGLTVIGAKDADGVAGQALQLVGALGETAADTAKTTAAIGVVHTASWIKDGTTIKVCGANENLVVFANGTTARFIFDAEGSAHGDVEWVAFDDHDDLALLEMLEGEFARRKDPIKNQFGEWMGEHKTTLQDSGVVNFYDDGPRAMVNFTRLQMLSVGAIRQMAQRLERYEQALIGLGVEPALLS
jgi:hypothetical protein